MVDAANGSCNTMVVEVKLADPLKSKKTIGECRLRQLLVSQIKPQYNRSCSLAFCFVCVVGGFFFFGFRWFYHELLLCLHLSCNRWPLRAVVLVNSAPQLGQLALVA